MYYKITNGGNIWPDSPEKGTLPDEVELIVEDDDEVMNIIVDNIADNGELREIYYGIDEHTDEPIELKTSEHLSNGQIDMINDMLMDCDEWSECQVRYILNNLQLKQIEVKVAKDET